MEFKPYPLYIPCDIHWFNEIPQSWKQVRVEQYLIKKDENIGDLWDSTQLLSLTQKGIIEKDINEGKGKTHSDYSTYQAIDIGDLVFCLFDIDETPRTVGLSTKKGMITSAYTAFKSKENINTQYVYYFFESLDDAKALKPYYKGLRKTVRPPEFLKIHVPFPPKVEQVAISQFLDTETARIDNLISKQEKLIELLEEQRKSIISHAVTKGLNPNAPMKDSGVEWLGEVPEDWEVKRFGYIFTENKKKNIGLIETNVLSLSYGNIKEKNIDDNKGLLPESFETYQIIEPNDIVFRFTDLQNDKRSLRNAISKYHGIITSAYIGVKTKENADFYNYLFRAYDLQKVFYSMGDGMRQSLKMDELNKMPIVLPKIEAQERIVKFINEENQRINNLVVKQKNLIEKLKEYRSSIISHAVTGKIDVREFGA